MDNTASLSYSENKFFLPDDYEDPDPDEIVDDEADDDTGIRRSKSKTTDISVKLYNPSMNESELVGASDDLTSERGKLIKKYKEALHFNRKDDSKQLNSITATFNEDDKLGGYLTLLLTNHPHLKATDEALITLSNFINDISNSLISELSSNSEITSTDVNKAILNLLEDSKKTLRVIIDPVTPKHLKLSNYFATADELTKQLTELISDDGWQYVRVVDNVHIFKRIMEGTMIQCTKGSSEIKAPAKVLKNIIKTLYNSSKWYPMLEGGDKIETLDHCTEVWRWRFATRFCIFKQQRDFVILRHFFQRSDGSYMLAAKSVEHDEVPESSGYIRGEILASGFHIKPHEDNPNMCTLTYIANVDPKGELPEFMRARFLNMIAEQQPLLVNHLRKYVEGLGPDIINSLNVDSM